MLLHEWLQYRDRRIRRLQSQEDEEERETEEATDEPGAPEGPDADEAQSAPVAEQDAEPAAGRPSESVLRAPGRTRLPEEDVGASGRPAPKTAQEVLETLQPTQDVRSRLEVVLARQRRLPIDEEDEDQGQPRQRRAAETREQLVGRLLDPTLTLQETALLLGVCPTTVRRYTNRGILKCFRTPGNQRRFKLSDVLEFMERREQGEV